MQTIEIFEKLTGNQICGHLLLHLFSCSSSVVFPFHFFGFVNFVFFSFLSPVSNLICGNCALIIFSHFHFCATVYPPAVMKSVQRWKNNEKVKERCGKDGFINQEIGAAGDCLILVGWSLKCVGDIKVSKNSFFFWSLVILSFV